MTEFRRRQNSQRWHWCRTCSNYPTEQDVIISHTTPEHHIAWIELYGVKKDNDQAINLGRAAWAPVYSNPNVRFQINQIEEFKSFHALAYCNIHGLWANSLERQS